MCMIMYVTINMIWFLEHKLTFQSTLYFKLIYTSLLIQMEIMYSLHLFDDLSY